MIYTGLVKIYYNNIYTKDKKKEIQNDGLEDGYNVVVLKERMLAVHNIYIKSISHNNMICRKRKKRFITGNNMEGHNFNRRGCIATPNC